MMRFGVAIVTGDSSGDAGRCADELWHLLCTCSGFPTEKVEQTILTSLDDVTVIPCAIGGGKYIRRASSSFRDCHLGIWH